MRARVSFTDTMAEALHRVVQDGAQGCAGWLSDRHRGVG